MQTQIALKEQLVNPALIQENRRLRAKLDAANKKIAMQQKLINYYHAKDNRKYSVKDQRRRDIGDLVFEILLAGRWAFVAVVFMVASWHIWMAVWGMNV